MFPDYSIDLIKTKFAESDFNAKKCVDILLKEKQIIIDKLNQKLDKQHGDIKKLNDKLNVIFNLK
jgi:hypothetical protein